jgi:hypothetical protein
MSPSSNTGSSSAVLQSGGSISPASPVSSETSKQNGIQSSSQAVEALSFETGTPNFARPTFVAQIVVSDLSCCYGMQPC